MDLNDLNTIIETELGVSREHPKVCVNLQTDVR